jgi:glycosyltransferase involved in cell wall biosynthesis
MPDIVLHEKNGWLAKPKDISNLAKGISWLLNADDNQEWIQNIRRIARETVVSGFSIENQTRKFISLYKDILKSP